MLNEISIYLLNPKWLIAPSMRVGYQWLDQVAREDQPALNVHVKTFKRMVLDIASPYLIENGQVFLQKAQAEIILHDLLSKALNESKYFRLPNLDQNLVQTFLKSINDLRQADLNSNKLSSDSFENKQKGAEIAQILHEYEQALDKNRLVDYADVLEVASEAISKDPANVLRGCKILIPDYLPADLHGLELKLWNTIPELNKHLLSIDKSADSNANRATDSSLLGHILNPDQAPEPHGDDTVRIFSSIGEVNEIRGLFRFCMENRIPYDEVELLYTDSVEYLPLIYEEAMQYADTRESIPATFAEGIPIYFTSSGKALIGLIEWKKSNYPRKILLDLLQDRLIVYHREDDEKVNARKLASTLRKLPIGIGRDNYLKTIDIWMGDIEETAKNAAKDSESPDRLANLQNEFESLEELKSLIEKLFKCLSEESGLNNKLDGYMSFLENHVKCSGQLDEYGRTMLLKKINEFKDAILSLDVKRFNLDDWLADQIQSEKVGGQGPRPGCIYAAPLSNGGHSGRKFAFIVGMDDGRFPGSAIQDPILLDNERNRLSPQLQTTIGDLSKPYEKLALLLSGLRGTVILSYPCYDLNDDSEKFPSQALLSVFRIISGNHQGDQSDFSKFLSSPHSFSPSTPEQSLSRSEWWINRLSEDIIIPDLDEVIPHYYPYIARGVEAKRARESDDFTEYDGFVPEAGADCDPASPDGLVLSAQRLETLGKNPLEFFFKYILRVEHPEEYKYNPNIWLDPLLKGTLLHRVFYQFMTELQKSGRIPNIKTDHDQIIKILKKQINYYKGRYIPANRDIFEKELNEFKQAVWIFLCEEDEHCKNNIPNFFEVAIGLKSEGEGTPLDSLDPVTIKISDTLKIRARGKIDRIDQMQLSGDLSFSVWDYKSGGKWKHKDYQKDPFEKGRIVQNILYKLIAEQQLRKTISLESTVAKFGYFFPNLKEHGERIEYDAEKLIKGQSVLSNLCQMISSGCFPPSDDEGDFKFSDYLIALGEKTKSMESINRKLNNPQNEALEPFRNLRGIEIEDKKMQEQNG